MSFICHSFECKMFYLSLNNKYECFNYAAADVLFFRKYDFITYIIGLVKIHMTCPIKKLQFLKDMSISLSLSHSFCSSEFLFGRPFYKKLLEYA